MKLSNWFLLCLSYLSAVVVAGGYQGALERVLLYQAYEIDALNGETAQTIGFRCKRWNFNAKKCEQPQDGSDPYEPCQGRIRNDRRCTFDELMFFLGGAPLRTGFSTGAVDGSHRITDTQRAAVNTFNIFSRNPRGVHNFPAFKAMKGDVHEFNDFIKKLGISIHNTWRHHGAGDARLQFKWTDFRQTLDALNVARAGDHGRAWLVAEVQRSPHLRGLQPQIQDLGTNPATGDQWQTVDWVATVQNRDPGVSLADAEQKVKNFKQEWYHGTQTSENHKEARKHNAVIQSWKRVEARISVCQRLF